MKAKDVDSIFPDETGSFFNTDFIVSGEKGSSKPASNTEAGWADILTSSPSPFNLSPRMCASSHRGSLPTLGEKRGATAAIPGSCSSQEYLRGRSNSVASLVEIENHHSSSQCQASSPYTPTVDYLRERRSRFDATDGTKADLGSVAGIKEDFALFNPSLTPDHAEDKTWLSKTWSRHFEPPTMPLPHHSDGDVGQFALAFDEINVHTNVSGSRESTVLSPCEKNKPTQLHVESYPDSVPKSVASERACSQKATSKMDPSAAPIPPLHVAPISSFPAFCDFEEAASEVQNTLSPRVDDSSPSVKAHSGASRHNLTAGSTPHDKPYSNDLLQLSETSSAGASRPGTPGFITARSGDEGLPQFDGAFAPASPREDMARSTAFLSKHQSRRWRFYCFANAFVLEPFAHDDGLIYSLRRQTAVHKTTPTELFYDLPTSKVPQLIIKRFSNDIFQTQDSTHSYYDAFGQLEQIYIVEALLGILHILDTRFLVVVAETYNAASFDLSVLNESLGWKCRPGWSRISHVAFHPRHTAADAAHIRKVSNVWCVPFHLSLKSRSLKLDSHDWQLGAGDFDAVHRRTHAPPPANGPRGVSRPPKSSHDAIADYRRTRFRQQQSPQRGQGLRIGDYHGEPELDPSLSIWAVCGYGDQTLNNLLGSRRSFLKRCVEEYLASSFYYSWDMDITHTMQRMRLAGRMYRKQGWPCDYGPENTAGYTLINEADERFVWNLGLLAPLQSSGVDLRWITPIIHGAVLSSTLISGTYAMQFALICRRSRHRAGTRFTFRGIDDDGNVANFNETEQLLLFCDANAKTLELFDRGNADTLSHWISSVQIRGSAPLFWKQAGTFKQSQQLTREVEFAQKAFHLHQRNLATIYGHILYLDLLNHKRTSEYALSDALRRVLSGELGTEGVYYFHWDFYNQVKLRGFENSLEQLYKEIAPFTRKYGHFQALSGCQSSTTHFKKLSDDGSSLSQPDSRMPCKYQTGVVRTNCLDCLDRTNASQWWIAWAWTAECIKDQNAPIFQNPGYRFEGKVLLAYFDIILDKGVSPHLREGGKSSQLSNNLGELKICNKSDSPVSLQTVQTLDSEPRESRSNVQKPETFFWTVKQLDKLAAIIQFYGTNGHRSMFVSTCGIEEENVINLYIFGTESDNSALFLAQALTSGDDFFDPDFHYGEFLNHGVFAPNIVKSVVADVWAEHGDLISRSHAGTTSVLSKLIRSGKATLATNLDHYLTSLERFCRGSADESKQDAIDLILGDSLYTHGRRDQATSILASPLGPGEGEGIEARTGSEVLKPLRVWFGTWNIGGRIPEESLKPWLMAQNPNEPAPDVYVVAFQELIELTGIRVVFSQSDKERERRLQLSIKEALGEQYLMLQAHSLVGLYLTIFIKDDIKNLVSHVQIAELKLGFKGQMGNKGAVLMRCNVGLTSFCFISVHLTSGTDKALQRRQQIHSILTTCFPTRHQLMAKDHEYVFLGGDFNFRCDTTPKFCEDIIELGRWKALLAVDEFILSKFQNLSPFAELSEQSINFPPTYKFRPGSDKLDKSRIPGWCDRILFTGSFARSQDGFKNIDCVMYQSYQSLLTSDHKPVAGVFQVLIKLR